MLWKQSLHPPALDAAGDEEEEIPWVLLENFAYVADRRNATTAYASCGSNDDGVIQASLFVARPPRVSYICVSYRCWRPQGQAEQQQQQQDDEDLQMRMIPTEPKVIATDESVVLLRITVLVGHQRRDGWYAYLPGVPLLRRLDPPQEGFMFYPSSVGVVSCRRASRRDDQEDMDISNASGGGFGLVSCPDRDRGLSDDYMVAALCHDYHYTANDPEGHRRFILYVFDSKLHTWTETRVALDDQHYQKYQQSGDFFHYNTKTITVGGEGATIGFVDLWRGILLCDLAHVQDKPWLRYVPIPHRDPLPASYSGTDVRFSRDIAVVDGQFKYVRRLPRVKPCPYPGDHHDIITGWTCDVFTRPAFATALSDDTCWEPVCGVDSSKMVDVASSPGFQLLPTFDDGQGRTLPPFMGIEVAQPVLCLDDSSDTTAVVCCFMTRTLDDHKTAWVMDVDMNNNRLREVTEFGAFSRYYRSGIGYKQSRISRYLKARAPAGTRENQKRKGMLPLLPGSANKKVPCWGREAEIEGMVEDGGDMPLE